MSYFNEIDAWLEGILVIDEDEGEEEWFARVKSKIKEKLLESYRNGQKAGMKPGKPIQADVQEPQKKRFPFARKPKRQ